jgi:hypothetical protein
MSRGALNDNPAIMNDITVKIINLVYVLSAFAIVRRLDLPVLRGSVHAYAWAVVFVASVFFAIGLLLFNIPFGFFGMSSPQAAQRSREIWWVAPLFPFTCFIAILGLRILILRSRRNTNS